MREVRGFKTVVSCRHQSTKTCRQLGATQIATGAVGRCQPHGTLRHAQPDKLLEAAARTMVRRYRDAYATRPGVTYAFLPCVMSTSGRIHGEFLRFLYILAHRRTKRWFERLGYEPSAEAFKFRRGQYFWHTRAAIGHDTALAVVARASPSTPCAATAPAYPPDDLLHPYTAPVAI